MHLLAKNIVIFRVSIGASRARFQKRKRWARASSIGAAAEEFDNRGFRDLLPEVAVEFRKLDGESYDADALKHLEDYLLAAGFDAEALRICEHFLPILREDSELMPYAVRSLCNQ